MGQLLRFEFGKLLRKKLVLAALGAYVFVMAILLINQRPGNLEVSAPDGQVYQGREAVEYEKDIAGKYSGELNADKVNDIIRRAKTSDNIDEFVYNGDWVTLSVLFMFPPESWDKLEYTNDEAIKDAYPQTEEKPFQIGYTRGWETAMICIESLLLIAGFLIVITVAPVFSEEYASGMDALILTGKRGKSACVYAKIAASVCFSILLVLFTAAVPFFCMLLQYGTAGWDASIQVGVLGVFQSVPYTFNSMQGMMLIVALAAVGAILLTCITLLVSALSKNSFTAVLIALLIYALPIVLLGKLDILLLNQLLSIMPCGDFNAAVVLGMEDMKIGGLHIPMVCLNMILTAAMGFAAWFGSRKIFGGHQVT